MRGKKIINFLIISITAGIILWIGIKEYQDSKISTHYDIEKINSQYQKEKEAPQIQNENFEKEEYPKEEIKEEYQGYAVAAKLVIPAIELETYILEQYSKKALNVSVTKFWGADANQEGNFCIAGHNFQNKNMFHNLKKLKIGQTFFISDKHIGKVEYEIYDIYIVEPDDVRCLAQETEGRREVTLITCTSDSSKRIIVKAKEG